MAILAMCMPILPGKKERWQQMMDKLQQEPLKSAFKKSREEAGVHERTFLQETPAGDFLIITIEGDDPAAGFGKMMANPPEMDVDFAEFAKDVHGLDMSGPPPPMPQLVFDSKG